MDNPGASLGRLVDNGEAVDHHPPTGLPTPSQGYPPHGSTGLVAGWDFQGIGFVFKVEKHPACGRRRPGAGRRVGRPARRAQPVAGAPVRCWKGRLVALFAACGDPAGTGISGSRWTEFHPVQWGCRRTPCHAGPTAKSKAKAEQEGAFYKSLQINRLQGGVCSLWVSRGLLTLGEQG